MATGIQSMALKQTLSRIQGEYLEMPGLRLTLAQARRLWSLEPPQCEALLMALVDVNFLRRTSDGAFVRVSSGRSALQGIS